MKIENPRVLWVTDQPLENQLNISFRLKFGLQDRDQSQRELKFQIEAA